MTSRVLDALWLACSATLASCSTQYADPVRAGEPAAVGCARWQTESECNADEANGCSVQPNDVGCHLDDGACAPWQCASGDPFVHRSGAALTLKSQPFRFVGANAWGVAWGSSCTYGGTFPNQKAALAQTFGDLADMRVQVLRAWAFQSYAGSSGADYGALDEVVRYARAAGVRLILVLENNYDDCSKGTRDDAWFQDGFAQPYGGYTLSFPDYVRGVVTHFRDEPTVLGWEVMHEAGANDVAALNAFFTQMSATIRKADLNHHLIVLGTNNGDSPATSHEGDPSPYTALNALDTVDMVDVQDFGEPNAVITNGERTSCGVAQRLDKPCFVGASAVSIIDASSAELSLRGSRVSAKLQGAFDASYSGFLVYAYTPGWGNPSFDFDGRSEEPLAGSGGVLADFAARLRTPRK